jgi:hypothetical protein
MHRQAVEAGSIYPRGFRMTTTLTVAEQMAEDLAAECDRLRAIASQETLRTDVATERVEHEAGKARDWRTTAYFWMGVIADQGTGTAEVVMKDLREGLTVRRVTLEEYREKYFAGLLCGCADVGVREGQVAK